MLVCSIFYIIVTSYINDILHLILFKTPIDISLSKISLHSFLFTMSYNVGASNASSSEEEEYPLFPVANDPDDTANDLDETAISIMIQNNNMIIAHGINMRRRQSIHGGSIPGHIVINRDREAADNNLYDDYLAVIHDSMPICFVEGIECLDLFSFVLLMQLQIMITTSNNDVMDLAELDYQYCKKQLPCFGY